LAVGLPFAAAVVILLLGPRVGRRAGWIVVVAALASVGFLSRLALDAAAPRQFTVPWLPALGVTFSMRGDPFGLFFALLVAGMGVLIGLYSLGYLVGELHDRVRRYYAALAAFMGAMLGIALADDLILLFVFWEITSITSFLLIGFRSEEESVRAGALTALQVTALGGIVMVVGFLLVGIVTGTYSLSALVTDPDLAARLGASPLADAALLLILCGAFTKSAQVPFHFWLPRAMVAPTPVSAYLHAATMVKAGVFLLGRMLPIFGGSSLWAPLVVTVGTTTMVVGAYQALRETDLKGILAHTTGSALGAMVLLYGIGDAGQDALQMLSHALYKGALFLIAGVVEHHAHTRSLKELGGLRRRLPLAFVACVLGALSMAGIAPLLGFLAKESFYSALLGSPVLGGRPLLHAVVVTACIAASALLVAVAWRFTAGVFLGTPPRALARRLAEQGPDPATTSLLWAPPVLLAAGALALGLLGATERTGELVAAASSRAPAGLHVSLVPTSAGPLVVSFVALGLAVLLYRERRHFDALRARVGAMPSAGEVWDRVLGDVVRVAEACSGRWQNGSLRWYLAVTLLCLPALVLYTLHAGGLSNRNVGLRVGEMPWYGLLFCVLLGIATIAAVRAATRLGAAIATTAIGFLVSMLFVVYRSPDILLTQILIETVSTIFIVLVLIFLPPFRRHDLAPGARAVHLAVAAAFGLAVTLLLLLATTPGLREPDNIATRPGGLLALSLAQGGGANAVNVIIVDIRAIDTNGEITVLVVVGLCIYGLLRARRRSA
jgi:NADH:ubiquinone oxidoreductase subunit 5 (subunit L)/multisubunit Na+/H+ antiporter MnhA subunit